MNDTSREAIRHVVAYLRITGTSDAAKLIEALAAERDALIAQRDIALSSNDTCQREFIDYRQKNPGGPTWDAYNTATAAKETAERERDEAMADKRRYACIKSRLATSGSVSFADATKNLTGWRIDLTDICGYGATPDFDAAIDAAIAKDAIRATGDGK